MSSPASVTRRVVARVRIGGRTYSLRVRAAALPTSGVADELPVPGFEPPATASVSDVPSGAAGTDPQPGVEPTTAIETQPPPPFTCEDGNVVSDASKCQTYTCWDKTRVGNPDRCPGYEVCWDGVKVHTLEQCSEPVYCWDNVRVHKQSECSYEHKCWNGQSYHSPAQCPVQPRCANGQLVMDQSVCGSRPAATGASGLRFRKGQQHTVWMGNYASDPDSDIVRYEFTQFTFGLSSFGFGTDYATKIWLNNPNASAVQSFQYRAIDSKGNASDWAMFRFQTV
jgi:hypothetical protein